MSPIFVQYVTKSWGGAWNEARLGLPEGTEIVITGPVYDVKVRSGSAADGSVPAVPYLPVDVARVKPLKIQAHLEEVLVHTRQLQEKVEW